MTQQRIGYIGLGQMGGGMASHLLENGYTVIVYDIKPELIDALVRKGATAAHSPREVAEQSDIIISSLPNPRVVEEVALGPEGIVAGLSPGKIYIDMSTIDPATTRKVGAAVAAKQAYMLDIPVGKGPPAAAKGDLTLMIGGDRVIVERCKALLSTLGSTHFYCGELGMGVTTKIVNNLVSCAINTLVGEAFAIGAAAGLNLEVLREVMMATAADNVHVRNSVKNHILPRNFQQTTFKLELAQKDLQLATQMAAEYKIPSIMGSASLHLHTLALGKGLGNEDQTACIKIWEECSGVEVRSNPITFSPRP